MQVKRKSIRNSCYAFDMVGDCFRSPVYCTRYNFIVMTCNFLNSYKPGRKRTCRGNFRPYHPLLFPKLDARNLIILIIYGVQLFPISIIYMSYNAVIKHSFWSIKRYWFFREWLPITYDCGLETVLIKRYL